MLGNRITSLRRRIAYAGVGVVITACSGGTSPEPLSSGPTAQVVVTPSTPTITLGGTQPLQAQAKDADGKIVAGAAIFWSSSDTDVAVVSDAGVVTAQGIGTTQIAASAEGKSAVAAVTVVPVPVASVSVVPTAVTIAAGTSAPFQALAYDAAGTSLSGRATVWATSNPAVATVDANGTVTAVAVGSATITATSEGKTGSGTVTVPTPTTPTTPPTTSPTTPTAGPAHHVVISPSIATIMLSDTITLTARVYDANNVELAGQTITWKSSKSTIATVSSTGSLTAQVTAKKTGTTNITASAQGLSSTLLITVIRTASGS
jgi:uncharacterized protein YjdB